MRKKKFAAPSNREEFRSLQKKLAENSETGCSLNRTKKRQQKILRKRLNPKLKREYDLGALAEDGDVTDEEASSDNRLHPH